MTRAEMVVEMVEGKINIFPSDPFPMANDNCVEEIYRAWVEGGRTSEVLITFDFYARKAVVHKGEGHE